MGILDDLREQANQKQAEQHEDALAREKLEHNYQVQILPKMQQLFSYFKELTEYLSVIEEPIEIFNYSDRYSGLSVLYQQDYRLSSDKHGGIANYEKLTEVNLRYNLLNTEEEDLIHHVENKLESDQEKDFLSSHKIKFQCGQHLGNTKGGATTFHIQRRIPVLFQFVVDYNKSQIILHIHNHEDFEQRRQVINPNHINEAFMDKLARYILRKDTEFIRIELDETSREKIREQVEAHKRAHAKELEEAHKREQELLAQEEENNMASRVKSFIKKF